MMAVLLRWVLYPRPNTEFPDQPAPSLKDVPDPNKIALDGQNIEERMKKLCEAAAEDIKQCANVCDTYLK